MVFRIIDEAESIDSLIVFTCCTYWYYTKEDESPWDIDIDAAI